MPRSLFGEAQNLAERAERRALRKAEYKALTKLAKQPSSEIERAVRGESDWGKAKDAFDAAQEAHSKRLDKINQRRISQGKRALGGGSDEYNRDELGRFAPS